jgi:hypothetical protein
MLCCVYSYVYNKKERRGKTAFLLHPILPLWNEIILEDVFELFLNYFTSAWAGCIRKPEGLLGSFVIVRTGAGPPQRQLETFPAPFSHSFETFARDGFSSTNCVPFEQSAKLFFYICSLPYLLNNSPSYWSICHCLFRLCCISMYSINAPTRKH